MSIDWSALSSIVGFVAVIVAVIALVIETRKSRFALETEVILMLTKRMDSGIVRSLRRAAAKKLLKGETPNFELEEVLGFFGTVAFLVESKAINPDLTFKEFSWWMIRYWLCAEDHVRKARITDPLCWATLERVVKKLADREQKAGYAPPSAEMLQAFLQCEAELLES